MAAGKSPPIAPPTDATELKEEAVEEEFQDTFSPSPQPSMMTDNQLIPPSSQVGEEDMEKFEANLLAQETEDRLTQLMLDDELSDARLGLAMEPGIEQSLSPAASIPSFTSSVAIDQTLPTDRTQLEVAKQSLTASRELLGDRNVHVGSKSVVVTTHEELTLDVKEKERLEDSLIIAG